MRKAVMLLALAAMTIASPVVATAQAAKPKYVVTSVHQIAPNTLTYLLSHWAGAGALEQKMREMESRMGVSLTSVEGPEGKQGVQGIAGPAGPEGPQGESIEGPEGRASTLAGPQGIQGERGETGEAGPEGAASTVPGPRGETGAQGPRGLPCNAAEEVACRSTVPGPQGETGARGEKGDTGPASTVPGPTGPRGEAGPAGPAGPAGEAGAGSSLPSTYTVGLGYSSHMVRGQEFTMFNRLLPPGSYLVTGNISFENRNEGAVPESILCRILLGGNMIDQTPTIASSIAVAGRNNSSAVVVASTGQITQEERLEVKCINVSQSGPQEEFPQFGQLAATAVTFK